MLLKQPNSIIFAIVLMLLGMVFMTAGRLVMNSSRSLYVFLMAATAICSIGSGYSLFRNK